MDRDQFSPHILGMRKRTPEAFIPSHFEPKPSPRPDRRVLTDPITNGLYLMILGRLSDIRPSCPPPSQEKFPWPYVSKELMNAAPADARILVTCTEGIGPSGKQLGAT